MASAPNSQDLVTRKYLSLSTDICKTWNINLPCRAEDLSIIDHFSQENHDLAVDKEKIMKAILLVANTEGVILDPEYTGKAMAVLIEMVRQNRFDRESNIVFIHTGGLPTLFVGPETSRSPVLSGVTWLYKRYGAKYGIVRRVRNILSRRA